MHSHSISEISATELKELLDSKSELQLVDVREPFEYEVSNITEIHIPLQTLPNSLDKLDALKKTIMICRSGARSAQATMFLTQNGFTDVHNLTGGMKAWKAEIAPEISVA